MRIFLLVHNSIDGIWECEGRCVKEYQKKLDKSWTKSPVVFESQVGSSERSRALYSGKKGLIGVANRFRENHL